MGFRLHTSQGLWIFLQNFSCHLWEPCQPSHALYSLPVSLWWCGFFHMSLVIRFLSSYCSVYYSGWFFFNLVVISVWSWEEVSVSSTYSFAIFQPEKGTCSDLTHSLVPFWLHFFLSWSRINSPASFCWRPCLMEQYLTRNNLSLLFWLSSLSQEGPKWNTFPT